MKKGRRREGDRKVEGGGTERQIDRDRELTLTDYPIVF